MKQNRHAFELEPDEPPLSIAPDEDLDPGETHSDLTDPFSADVGESAGSLSGSAADATVADAPQSSWCGDTMQDALRWALDSMAHPAMSAADWLAGDIDPASGTAVGLLTSPTLTLAQVRQAKTVYKTMRIVGESSADRRVGARMYAASIAAGLARFRVRVSTQSDAALKRGFQGLLDDRSMPLPLRDLAGTALVVLAELQSEEAASRSVTFRHRSA